MADDGRVGARPEVVQAFRPAVSMRLDIMNAKHLSAYLVPLGALLLTIPLGGAGSKVRIVQTNSAGDSVHLIDPATNKVVGEIKDIEVNHGAAAAPDGSRLYISNEAESTLDVVDAKTLKVTKHIPLSGHPNNCRSHRAMAAASTSRSPRRPARSTSSTRRR